MRLILHVFLKDVRHLWIYILAYLILLGLDVYVNVQGVPYLGSALASLGLVPVVLWLAFSLMILQLIYSEELTGQNQYWLTRPIGRWNLLVSKLLFLLALASLPLLLAQSATLAAVGFSPLSHWSGLATRQFVFACVLILPIVALATVSRGVVEAAIGLFLLFMANQIVSVLLGLVFRWTAIREYVGSGQSPSWIEASVMLLLIGAGAGTIILIQYLRRRTGLARALLVSLLPLLYVASVLIPYEPIYSLRERFQAEQVSDWTIQAHLAAPGSITFDEQDRSGASGSYVSLILPLRITGLADDRWVQADGAALWVESPVGREHLRAVELTGRKDRGRLSGNLTREYYRTVQFEPVRLTGLVHLAVYRTGRTWSVLANATSFHVEDVDTVCEAGLGSVWMCRSPSYSGTVVDRDRFDLRQHMLPAQPIITSPWFSPWVSTYQLQKFKPPGELETWRMVALTRARFSAESVRLADYFEIE